MTYVLTLQLDASSQAFFERTRQAHYPPERNEIAAHLTLFHTLPDSTDIQENLHQVASRTPSFQVMITGLRSLGRGVAYTCQSADLLRLHDDLASGFSEYLTAQDRQRFKPHIVIQNKATPERARTLLADLERSFHALEAQAVGLDLWHYLGGPWKHAEGFPFSG